MCKQSERFIGNGYIKKVGLKTLPFCLTYTPKNLFLAFLYKVHKVVKKKLCICWTT